MKQHAKWGCEERIFRAAAMADIAYHAVMFGNMLTIIEQLIKSFQKQQQS